VGDAGAVACAGKGIYLASELSKSAGYTQCGQQKGKPIGVLFLAEAALGKEHGIVRDDPSLVAPPKGGSCVSMGPATNCCRLIHVYQVNLA
jgi:Poly(ADP-ribose) polymerase catalytic domain